MNLTIVCAKCKYDQFRLIAVRMDMLSGVGTVQTECTRCGSNEYAGMSAEQMLDTVPGKAMYTEPLPL